MSRLFFLVALAAVVLTACSQNARPDPTPTATTITTQDRLVMNPGPAQASPTPQFGPIISTTATPVPSGPVGPTATITPYDDGTSPAPSDGEASDGTIFGPIVGPDHTLVPTETRLPATLPPTTVPTPGPSPTPLPGLQRNLMGVQIHPNIDSRELNEVLARARALDVAWIKFQFNWSLLEYAPGHYTELFFMLRQYVQQAHNQGFYVMVSVAKAPGWSRTPDTDGVMREDGPPDDPQALANFMSGMLNMIGFDSSGQPVIDAIEVWNEPNLQREWYGHPITGADYMRYFRPAYDAIRAFSPAITVITAAPAPTGDSQWSTNDRTWLQQLYDSGLAQYGQNVAVGIHPYGWANAPDAYCCIDNPGVGWDDQPQFFFLQTIEDYWQIMTTNGHANAQLWTTEFGWATYDGLRTGNGGSGPQPPVPPGQEYFGYIDQWQQADYTLQAFQLGQERPYMGPMILWNLNFATIPGAVDQSDPKAGYGLLDSLWQPRPVYTMLQQTPKN
ncbi:MAG: cellulase family glycosylhydrolase [Chloroflexi bacterium]|nr:cellulase family glycosylhydrolase [Chloroflexota bacterium]